MVKFGKNKLKALNKLTKNKDASKSNITNKIIKKKLNAEKKVSFQKEVLLKETVQSDTLVKNINKTELVLQQLTKKPKKEKKKVTIQEKVNKPKIKAVQKHKKRQQTQINDTKLLLKLMKQK